MKHILFICTGNTCRSSMAEGIFRRIIDRDERLKGKYTVSSAGIYASDGECASSHSIKALKENWDIDISSHRAKRLDKVDISKADIILTMTREHKKAVEMMFPEASIKVFTLKEFVMDETPDHNIDEYNFSLDILDPYGMPAAVYKRCAEEIRTSVDKLLRRLEENKM